MNRVLAFLITILPVCLYGQQNFQVTIGDNLPMVKDSTYFFRIKADVFTSTAYLYITSEGVQCEPNTYFLSILLERGEMWGPKEIKGDDVYDILNNASIKKLYPAFAKRFKHGDVLILENITSKNIQCTTPIRTIHIRLE